jgi:hypothetical protein
VSTAFNEVRLGKIKYKRTREGIKQRTDHMCGGYDSAGIVVIDASGGGSLLCDYTTVTAPSA